VRIGLRAARLTVVDLIRYDQLKTQLPLYERQISLQDSLITILRQENQEQKQIISRNQLQMSNQGAIFQAQSTQIKDLNKQLAARRREGRLLIGGLAAAIIYGVIKSL
jgi:hypothetical protein